jgi:hypothetical protein
LKHFGELLPKRFYMANFLEAARIGTRCVYVESRHGMLDHSGKLPSFPSDKERARARDPTIHH